jgi:4-amino-4-deoxy-L-arabinose transferase-like glycosyltransferase
VPQRRELALLLFLFGAGLGLRYAMTAHWCFAGSDSYGYLKLSDELRQNGRLALAPDQPLQWARLPLYPMFLAVKGDAPVDRDWRGDPAKGSGWLRITRAQAWVDMLVVGLLVWAMVRKLAGPRAALIAFGVAAFSPFTTPVVGSVLTETLAIALSTAALAPLVLWRDKPRRAFALSGALVGLGMLLRADSILLMAAWPPALFYLCPSWRERLRAGALAALCCAIVFAPWPIRNYQQFGAPHPIGARINRDSQPLQNVDGYWQWLRSHARTWRPTTFGWTCFYDYHPEICKGVLPELEQLQAFDSQQEKDFVVSLFARRAKMGLTTGIDHDFAELARTRAEKRPFWVYVVLPLLRAGNMWVTWYAETLVAPAWRPLKPLSDWVYRGMFPMTLIQLILILASLAFLLRRTQYRWLAATLLSAMLVRTLVLAWTAYSMPRYALEVMPVAWVLIAVAAREAFISFRTWRAARAPSS